MTAKLRNVLALLTALLLALSATGTEGGEGGGGTGVWILPACAFLNSGNLEGVPPQTSRMEIQAGEATSDIQLQVSSELGAVSATFFDEYSGSAMGLDVSGHRVIIGSELLMTMHACGSAGGSIVICDSSQKGYVISLLMDAAGHVTLKVR
ncbi:MAG: hypothetical protein AB8H80_01065 [Planctomycetota bacterium]